MAKMDYNSINFKNKDIDRFSTKFGNGPGDPIGKFNKDKKLRKRPTPTPAAPAAKKPTPTPAAKKPTPTPAAPAAEKETVKTIETTVIKPDVKPAERYTSKLVLSSDASIAKKQWDLYGPGGKYSEGIDSRGVKDPNK